MYYAQSMRTKMSGHILGMKNLFKICHFLKKYQNAKTVYAFLAYDIHIGSRVGSWFEADLLGKREDFRLERGVLRE